VNCFVVGQARKNHVGSACQFNNVFSNETSLFCHGFRLSDIPVVCDEWVPVIKQASCDAASHRAESNESKFRVVCCKKFHGLFCLLNSDSLRRLNSVDVGLQRIRSISDSKPGKQ
jgi:hypothetical protein